MKIDTEGTYTLRYTAEDECGNIATADRTVVVEAPLTYRTVLYTDGTLIINEKSSDIASNVALHGAATNVYIPFDPNGSTNTEKYIFTSASGRPWHSQSASIKAVEIGSNISPTSTAYWFNDFTTCTSMNLSKLNTSNVTSMWGMFYNCAALTSLNVTHFDTSNVTNMMYMFYYCQALTSLDVSHFNTGNVMYTSHMFDHCQALTSLDVTHFDTSNVTDMVAMFNNCQALTSLDLSHFDTSNVTKMSDMFINCAALTSLDVSHFNTSNVTDMSYMFNYCQALTSLDLSHFDTSNVTKMSYMFQECRALTTIYASANFVVTQVTSSANMFRYMSTNLVGGAGTVWSSSNPRDKTYARIDNPPSAPGYFTARS